MSSQERLLAVMKQTNPQAALLTVDDVVFSLPEVNSTYGRNTTLTITAKPDSGYSGSAVLYYNRHVLNVVFGQSISMTLNQGQQWADIVADLNRRSSVQVGIEHLAPVDPSGFVLNQFNAFQIIPVDGDLEWIGQVSVSAWLKLASETAPDVALEAVLALETRVETLEASMLTLNAITQGGIVHSVAGLSGNITREQLGLDKLDAMVAGFAASDVTRQNTSTDDLIFGQPVYSLGAQAVALADARDSNKNVVAGLVADAVILSNGGLGRVRTTGVLEGTVAQWNAATGMVGGLVTNKAYYLDIFNGRITPFAPSERGQFLTEIGTALSPTQLSIQLERPLSL